MSQTYKTNAQSIILIPDDSAGLPALPPGTMVLARYPETTTFYRAEVIATKVPLPFFTPFFGCMEAYFVEGWDL
jgi:SGF29 tudor-like domain